MITKPFSLSVLWTIFSAAAWLCVTCLQSECCSSLPEKPEPEGIKKEPPKFLLRNIHDMMVPFFRITIRTPRSHFVNRSLSGMKKGKVFTVKSEPIFGK